MDMGHGTATGEPVEQQEVGASPASPTMRLHLSLPTKVPSLTVVSETPEVDPLPGPLPHTKPAHPAAGPTL